MSQKYLGKSIQVMPRDHEIFLFLWKFKVATTSAIHQRFYSSSSAIACYKRLLKLSKFGLIQFLNSNKVTETCWTLTKNGFQRIKTWLPELQEEGFLSESITHDLVVGAVLTGHWLKEYPGASEIITEQELRRCHPRALPSWVPNTEYRRPDGYWRVHVDNEDWTIALEVELAQKESSRYTDILHKYNYMPGVDRVIWVVSQMSLAKVLLNKILVGHEVQSKTHNIVVLDDFGDYGWSAPILIGPEKDLSIEYLLTRGVSKRYKKFYRHPFLNFSKSGQNSISYPTPRGS